MKSIKFSIITALITISVIFSSCANQNEDKVSESAQSTSTETVTTTTTVASTTKITTTAKPEPVVREITLDFVGDILPHTPVIKSANRGEKFDFKPHFRYVKDLILDADYSVCNLETTLSGKGKGLNYGAVYEGYSGYPTFNSPEALAQNLKDVGFDMCLNANNHSLDGGMSGLLNTIAEAEKAGLDHIGTRKNKEDKNYLIKEINGIKVAFINYTYAMNGFMPSAEEDYRINHLGNYDEERINKAIEDAEKMVGEGADVNIACFHIGVEYGLYPDDYTQKRIIDKLFDAGIDIFIGDHSHTLQPFELVERNGKDKLIVYSMGNFLSNQMFYRINRPTDFGAIASIKIEKIDDGEAELKSFSFIPTYCYVKDNEYAIVPILDIPKDAKINEYDTSRLSVFNDNVLPRLVSLMQEEGEQKAERLVWELE